MAEVGACHYHHTTHVLVAWSLKLTSVLCNQHCSNTNYAELKGVLCLQYYYSTIFLHQGGLLPANKILILNNNLHQPSKNKMVLVVCIIVKWYAHRMWVLTHKWSML